MPSEPRPKGPNYAKPPSEKAVQAATAAKGDYPEGASVGPAPTEGIWFALVTDGGNIATSGDQPVRIP